MTVVLLPASRLERTVTLDLEDWAEPGWPDRLLLTVLHAGEAVHYEGGEYEVRPVTSPTLWRMQVALPGGMAVYSRDWAGDPDGAHPVTWREDLPAASLPKQTFPR